MQIGIFAFEKSGKKSRLAKNKSALCRAQVLQDSRPWLRFRFQLVPRFDRTVSKMAACGLDAPWM